MKIQNNHIVILINEFMKLPDGEDFLRYTLNFYGVKKFTELGDRLENVFLYLSDVLFNIKNMIKEK